VATPRGLKTAINRARRYLDTESQRLDRAILRDFRAQLNTISEDARAVERAWAEAVSRGISPAQTRRYASYLEDQREKVQRLSANASSLVTESIEAAQTIAPDHAVSLMEADRRAAISNGAGKTSVAVAFTKPRIEDIRAAVEFSRRGTPLAALFDSVALDHDGRVREAFLSGFRAGDSPRTVAYALRDVSSLTLARAMTISRTETLRAYRSATLETYKTNTDALTGWVWQAQPDACPVCMAMQGETFEVYEELAGHPACRCSMIPRSRSWAELGFDGITETSPSVPRGNDVISRMSEGKQRRLLGNTRFEAWKDGTVKDVREFVKVDPGGVWGPTAKLRTLSELGLTRLPPPLIRPRVERRTRRAARRVRG